MNVANRVAQINGINIFSDKKVRSIINTKVIFADGSWCDVATGQTVNNGPGYVNIELPAAKNADDNRATVQQAFTADALSIDNVDTDIDVQVHESPEIIVEVTGAAELVENIKVKLEDKNVTIKQIGQNIGGVTVITPKGNVYSTCHSNSPIMIGKGNVVGIGNIVNTQSDQNMLRAALTFVSQALRRIFNHILSENPLTISCNNNYPSITVKVPKGAAINLTGNIGNCIIGDTLGNLTADLNGSSDLKVGSVGDLSLKINGSGNANVERAMNASLIVNGAGEVNIGEASGTLTVRVSGSGNASVTHGRVSHLEAKVTGAGNILFDVLAETADLAVSGSGDITVLHVDKKPKTRISGSGDIWIGNW